MDDVEVIAFRMVLLPGKEDEYRRRHSTIWPDLITALRSAGVLDYQIFLDPETLHLIGVMRRRCDHELNTLRNSDIMRRWWSMMRDVMVTYPDDSPIEQPLDWMFTLPAGDAKA